MLGAPRTVPHPQDPHPGRFVHHLDFTHFRTIGMRRSIEEGMTGRFVTGERLLAVLKVISTCDSLHNPTEFRPGD